MNRKALVGVLVVLVVVAFLAIFLPVYLTQGNDAVTPPPEKLTPDQQFYKDVKDEERFDCYPDLDVTPSKKLCEERGCFWKPATLAKAPECFYPLTYGYQMTRLPVNTDLGWEAYLSRLDGVPSRYGNDVMNLKVEVEFQTDSRLHFKITDADSPRFEVPLVIDKPNKQPSDPMYEVSYKSNPFSIQVRRKSTGVLIFDSSVGGLTYEDQFLQLSTKLPSKYVYGFGEHNHQRFLHDVDYKTWTMFSRDVAPVDEWNLYGHHPYHMCIEERGNNAHSILFLNSNAMDVTLQPSPALTYRTIGGVLDFYIFLGPTPENLVTQYTEAVGRPAMPPYWALGFQLSRWNYNSLDRVKQVVKEMRDAEIPMDVLYGDIDYMDRYMDFTVDETNYGTQNLSDFVDDLHARGQRYIIILDHCIGKEVGYEAYDTGLTQDIFIKTPEGQVLEGEVWPAVNASVYPDFTDPSATPWWTSLCDSFHDEIAYDALWIDMNEPSNFVAGSQTGCEENTINNPPYLPNILGRIMPDGKRGLYDKTICMDAKQHLGNHYNLHSLYGHSMSVATHEALKTVFPTKRSMVLSRSTYVGSGAYTGHWLGDNQSQWRQMPWSIVGMLEFSLFGFTYTGSDICGFWFETTYEMCLRWSQVGAFYPFARNHNGRDWPAQHPAAFDDAFSANAKKVLEIRYKLLPFLYTLFYEATTTGTTVARPILHEFPETLGMNLDRQFLWGASFLITPVLEEGKTTVEAYIPNARWYDYYDSPGKEVDPSLRGTTTVLDADLMTINLHIRGGYVLPFQEPANTTVYSRMNPMGLIVALDENESASGQLFWDDGESRDSLAKEEYVLTEFSVEKASGMGTLQITPIITNYATALAFETIHVMGLKSVPTTAMANGVTIQSQNFQFDDDKKMLTLTGLDLGIINSHTVQWEE